MRKALCAVMILALIIAAMPAFTQEQPIQDPRLTELRQQYAQLARQKLEIESAMIRLEGMFIERQSILAEEAIGIEGEEVVEEPKAE